MTPTVRCWPALLRGAPRGRPRPEHRQGYRGCVRERCDPYKDEVIRRADLLVWRAALRPALSLRRRAGDFQAAAAALDRPAVLAMRRGALGCRRVLAQVDLSPRKGAKWRRAIRLRRGSGSQPSRLLAQTKATRRAKSITSPRAGSQTDYREGAVFESGDRYFPKRRAFYLELRRQLAR